MNKLHKLLYFGAFLMLHTSGTAVAQDFDEVEINVHPVAGQVYYIEGRGGNIGLFVGDDGVFLVDDQFAPLTAKIVAAIRLLSGKPIRFLVNAHHHPDHTGGMFIYGDPSGKAEDTRSEKGHNDFSIIMKELHKYSPTRRLHSKAPAVVSRINWINSIFGLKEGGISIEIDESCKITIQDYQLGKEAADGTKFKEKITDKETKVRYEAYHHVTDANDYFLTKCFKGAFRTYQRGGQTSNAETFKSERKSFSRY